MKQLVIAGLISLSIIAQDSELLIQRIYSDESLVIPGIGAEKIILHDNTAKLDKVYSGYNYKVAKVHKNEDIFKNVFKLNSGIKLQFNEIRYYKNNKVIVFIKNNIVEAIASLEMDRVTIDPIDLSQGVSNFILHYGNTDLQILKDGNNSAYAYTTKGIVLFDDNNDDVIDIYLVFKTLSANK